MRRHPKALWCCSCCRPLGPDLLDAKQRSEALDPIGRQRGEMGAVVFEPCGLLARAGAGGQTRLSCRWRRVAAVTPPSPGWQPATVASATAASPTDRPTTPTDGWHGPACTQSCWAWSCSAIAVGAGQPATPRNPGLRWGDRLLSVGPPHRTHAIGARSTIDEVRDRLRIMGGLPKIRTPGAQTGRCARRRATITACPVGWDRRPTRSQRDVVDRSATRSAQCAQPGGVRFALPAAGNPPDRLWPHHTGRRTVAATPAAVPIALGDGGRCGGQNSSCSSVNSVGS